MRTGDRREEDAHQQGEGGGDVSKHVRMVSGCGRRLVRGLEGTFLQHFSFAEVGTPQVLYKEIVNATQPSVRSVRLFYVKTYQR